MTLEHGTEYGNECVEMNSAQLRASSQEMEGLTLKYVPNVNRAWCVDQPWTAGDRSGKMPLKPTLTSKKAEKLTSEPLFRRTFPFVSLNLDKTQRNILVDTTEENVYIRVSERTLSVQTLLAEMGKGINVPEEELVILDSKCVPVTDDDKGQII